MKQNIEVKPETLDIEELGGSQIKTIRDKDGVKYGILPNYVQSKEDYLNSDENNNPIDGCISVEHLMKLHPELSKDEAKSLYDFSISKGIRLKQCYWNGEHMINLWRG